MKENNNELEGLGKKQKVFIMLQQIDWTGCIISFEPPHEKACLGGHLTGSDTNRPVHAGNS